MSLIACAFVLLVVSGLYTSFIAGAAAIMLGSELSDNMASIYDEPSLDYDFDYNYSTTKPTSVSAQIEVSESFYQPSFSDLKPMLARVDSVTSEHISFGSISGHSFDDYKSASTKAARIFRRRSTVFLEDTGLLFLRC